MCITVDFEVGRLYNKLRCSPCEYILSNLVCDFTCLSVVHVLCMQLIHSYLLPMIIQVHVTRWNTVQCIKRQLKMTDSSTARSTGERRGDLSPPPKKKTKYNYNNNNNN